MKKSAGEEKFINLGMTMETYRALRHLAVDHDLSVTRFLKNVINGLVTTRMSARPSVAGDFPEMIPAEMSTNGAETANGPDALIVGQGVESGG
jgi:hypothetical protein